MSRIGKKLIIIPSNVKASIDNSLISINGPKGELSYNISKLIKIEKIKDKLKLTKNYNHKKAQAIHGLSRSIINNMVLGVSQGFEKKLIINGVGYRSQMEGKNLILHVGYSHPVNIKPPENIQINVENSTNISIMGIDKEIVGQIAAKIRSIRPPEPYKGKGIKYIDEKIKRKVGKAGK
uniref:Large ribosomal subunit protein uL6c n=1 Tax=Cumathamnion serrulatum TaxID=1206573 RepID=A0A7U1AR12_9FLOR|nr:50S ribosomal protein L6 [Cumathamnion serrulatum]QQY85331.1 50S ribosomal protein L6 [Cumathamnion serrulatum]